MKSDEPEAKVWGKTICTVDAAPYLSRHRLLIDAGGYCSVHWHEHRANLFRVLSGTVRVVWTIGMEIFHQDLTSDMELVVASLVAHQFQCLDAAEMIEEYFPDRGGEVRLNDITRLTTGGLFSDPQTSLLDHPVCLVNSHGQRWHGATWSP